MAKKVNFATWLHKGIKQRGMTYTEVARTGGISHGRISQVISGDKPGWDFCEGIARAFNLPPEDVFRKAGLLPPEPPESATSREMLYMFLQLSEEDQEHIMDITRTFLEKKGRVIIGGEKPASA